MGFPRAGGVENAEAYFSSGGACVASSMPGGYMQVKHIPDVEGVMLI